MEAIHSPHCRIGLCGAVLRRIPGSRQASDKWLSRNQPGLEVILPGCDLYPIPERMAISRQGSRKPARNLTRHSHDSPRSDAPRHPWQKVFLPVEPAHNGVVLTFPDPESAGLQIRRDPCNPRSLGSSRAVYSRHLPAPPGQPHCMPARTRRNIQCPAGLERPQHSSQFRSRLLQSARCGRYIRHSCLRIFAFIIGAALAVPSLPAGEDAVLTNGFRLHADHHDVLPNSVRLYVGDGIIELPASAVDRFEHDPNEPGEAPLPPPPAIVPLPTPVQPPPGQPVPVTIPGTPAELAFRTARKYALPPEFVASVMETESAMRPGAVSPKGAIGLMQLMPDTARQLGVNPFDPAQNTDGGVRYLRDLLSRFEASPDQVLLALAAYNAGPEAVNRYRGVPPYAETRAYIIRVLSNWEKRKSVR